MRTEGVEKSLLLGELLRVLLRRAGRRGCGTLGQIEACDGDGSTLGIEVCFEIPSRGIEFVAGESDAHCRRLDFAEHPDARVSLDDRLRHRQVPSVVEQGFEDFPGLLFVGADLLQEDDVGSG